jgi:hypothetical protein
VQDATNHVLASTRSVVAEFKPDAVVIAVAPKARGKRETVSQELDKARQQFADGKYRQAVRTLWVVESNARADPDQAQGLLDLASAIRKAADERRVTRDCDLLIGYARTALERLSRQADDPARDALAIVRHCRVLGGHGLAPRAGETWDLLLLDTELLLHSALGGRCSIDYAAISALEVGGPGATRSGGGFFGGGLGAQGAAEGMLVAAALNLLTTRSRIDTVICLQTDAAELFLHHGETPPDALRMQLSPVFTKLRQLASARSADSDLSAGQASDRHVIDRLDKLAGLLERGLITDDEFARLKSDLLDQP